MPWCSTLNRSKRPGLALKAACMLKLFICRRCACRASQAGCWELLRGLMKCMPDILKIADFYLRFIMQMVSNNRKCYRHDYARQAGCRVRESQDMPADFRPAGRGWRCCCG